MEELMAKQIADRKTERNKKARKNRVSNKRAEWMRIATANKDLEKWGVKTTAYKGVFSDEWMEELAEKHPILESKVAIHNN